MKNMEIIYPPIEVTTTILNGEEVNSVNSRDIYDYLELVEGKHNRWLQRCIAKYEFDENIDYIPIDMDVSRNGISEKAYIVTIDMAKELCMISDTPKGKEVRKYFIDVEKKASSFQLPDFNNPVIAARAWAKEVEKKQILIDTVAKKDELIVTVGKLNIEAGQVSFSDFAKNIAIQGMGRNNTISFCKTRGYLMDNTEPYQPYIERGYFVRKPSDEKINGKIRYMTYLTPRGTVWLAKIIREEYKITYAVDAYYNKIDEGK